jgi:hypothetical protein
MPIDNLERFGSLLLDPTVVVGVVPLLADNDPSAVVGFRVLTSGGAIDVKDEESSNAIYAFFFSENPLSHVQLSGPARVNSSNPA